MSEVRRSSGFPPFPSFLSKLLLVQAFFAAGRGWMAAPFLLLVVVIVFGMGGSVFRMAYGDEPGEPAHLRPGFTALAPQIMLIFLLLSLGLGLPGPVRELLRQAAGLFR